MKIADVATLAACLVTMVAHAEEPRKVAFVDTGDTGRSLIAGTLARESVNTDKLPIAIIDRAIDMDPFDVSPEPNAATLLMQHGTDVSSHRAAQLSPNDVKHADVILTMTAKHKAAVIALYPDVKDKVFTLANYATGNNADVVDAYGQAMPAYGQIASSIAPALAHALKK